jgi:elongator complex protein 3
MSAQLFRDNRFKPDGLKLYPTMVVEDTELEKWYRAGRYQPYAVNTMVNLAARIKSIIPKYVRISRVLRDIPSQYIVAGCKDSLRDVVKQHMRQQGMECKCIRCREYGHRLREGWEIGEPQMVRMDYEASGGKEIFLSFEAERETLFGLLRMRLQPGPVPALHQPTNRNLAIIRELHIYGAEVPLAEHRDEAAQHKGLGKALLSEAERIAQDEFQARQILVLSGVGAREYYRTEFGYTSQGDYMVKKLPQSAKLKEHISHN